MVRVEDDAEIPESGAVFTFGKSKFSDNIPSKFWIRNDPVRQVACGDEHTIIVTENGRLYVFGSNDWGQLGLGNTKNITKPTNVKSLKHEKVLCAAGGRSHTIVSTESGKVYAFGANGEGQLGLGDTTDRLEPTLINEFEGKISLVTAGSYHSAIVTAAGKLYLFGSNTEGQLGLDDEKNCLTPTELQLGVQIVYADCGYYHTAVIADGKLYTFGEKEGGKLGLLDKQLQKGTRRPQCIFSITERVLAVSCGGNHTAAITACGKLYTFGSGLNGQLGLGTMIMESSSPSLVGALDNQKVISVACGESHTAVITEQGRLYTFGDGRHGKLGLGNENFSNHFTPVCIKKFAEYVVRQVACGGCHMLVLASKQDGGSVATDDSVQIDGNLSLAARNRRRQKEMDGNILKADRPLPPLNISVHESKTISNVEEDTAQEKNQLTESEMLADDQLKEIMQMDDAVESEPSAEPKSSKIKELYVVKKDNSLGEAKEASLPSTYLEKHCIIDKEKEVDVGSTKKNDVESQLYEESEEEEEEDDDEDDEIEESKKEKDHNKDLEVINEKESQLEVAKPEEHGTRSGGGGSNLDAVSSSNETNTAKKESFLKKIFSFKKTRGKPELNAKIQDEKDNVSNGDKSAQASPSDPSITPVENLTEGKDKQKGQQRVTDSAKGGTRQDSKAKGDGEKAKGSGEKAKGSGEKAKGDEEKAKGGGEKVKTAQLEASKTCTLI